MGQVLEMEGCLLGCLRHAVNLGITAVDLGVADQLALVVEHRFVLVEVGLHDGSLGVDAQVLLGHLTVGSLLYGVAHPVISAGIVDRGGTVYEMARPGP